MVANNPQVFSDLFTSPFYAYSTRQCYFINLSPLASLLPHASYNDPNHLKRFIASQNLTPVVQRFHPLTTPTRRTGNGRITIGHAGFLLRVGSMANMSRQSLGDGNLEEHRGRADHDNTGDDLLGQRRESSHFPLHIILVEGCNCPCYKLSLRIDGITEL